MLSSQGCLLSSLKSIWRPITSDQPQGLTLGLILFNIFTNDLDSEKEFSKEVCTQYRTGKVADTADGSAAIRGATGSTLTDWGMKQQENQQAHQRKMLNPALGEE